MTKAFAAKHVNTITVVKLVVEKRLRYQRDGTIPILDTRQYTIF